MKKRARTNPANRWSEFRHVLALPALALLGLAADPQASAGQEAESVKSIYVVAVYDTARDPFADLEVTVARAQAEGKRILLQVGGRWCSWCYILDSFIEKNPAVAGRLRESFLIMKVNFSGENQNRPFLSRYPAISGYPHIFVLESDGTFLHSQHTVELEKGDSYNEEALVRFLDKWAPR